MVDGAQRPVARPVARTDRSHVFLINLATLGNRDRLQEWFEWAVATGKCHETDRHRVFAVARSVVRRFANPGKGKPIQDPCAVFLSNVCAGRWKCASNADDDWAREAILAIDREESGLAREPQEPTE